MTAQQLAGDTNAFKNVVSKKEKRPRKLVVGESVANKHVQSVSTVRSVDIFVSRLHPATCEEDLVKCVDTMKGNIDVKAVMFTRLKSMYEALYTSYHVAVQEDSALLTQAVDVFMSAGAWPAGVFVKRFFKKRNGSASQQ